MMPPAALAAQAHRVHTVRGFMLAPPARDLASSGLQRSGRLACYGQPPGGVLMNPGTFYVPVVYWGSPPAAPLQTSEPPPPLPPPESPLRGPGAGAKQQQPCDEPILAMDTLKARIMGAAPEDVKAIIAGVQFVPRAAAFTSLIQMAAKSKQPQKAVEVFESMSAVNVKPNTFSYSALISALARAGRWKDAERYFNELAEQAEHDQDMQPNTVTYAALISAYEKGGQLDKALAAFDRQLTADVAPDLITYSSLISACERSGQLRKAAELLDQMHGTGLVGGHQLYHGLLAACQAAGQWELALEVFLGLQCATVRPTAHTINLLLGALSGAGQVAHALCLLREALRHHYAIHASSFNSVLQLLVSGGDWRAAMAVWQAMQLARVQPDTTTATLLLSAAMHGGNQALAAQLASEFVMRGLLQQPMQQAGPGSNRSADSQSGSYALPPGSRHSGGSAAAAGMRLRQVRSSSGSNSSSSTGGGMGPYSVAASFSPTCSAMSPRC